MKAVKMNANMLNPMQMNNISSMMGMMNLIQKIGKGKRKIVISLNKNDKKFFNKFINEIEKQFANSGELQQGLKDFFQYLKNTLSIKKNNDLKLSFEEYEFIKKILLQSTKEMENVKFKWYNFIKKLMLNLMKKQYKELLEKFK